jgi:hypothetical protein
VCVRDISRLPVCDHVEDMNTVIHSIEDAGDPPRGHISPAPVFDGDRAAHEAVRARELANEKRERAQDDGRQSTLSR